MTKRLWLLGAVLAASCTRPPDTEVVVVVRSSLTTSALYARLDVSWAGGIGPATECTRVGDGGVPFPLTFSLVPEGAAADPFDVHVAAYRDPACKDRQDLIAEQRARVRFDPGRRIALDLDLYPACTGTCTETQACAFNGVCSELMTRDADQVPTFDPGLLDPAPLPSACDAPRGDWLLCDGLEDLAAWGGGAPLGETTLVSVDRVEHHNGTGAAHLHVSYAPPGGADLAGYFGQYLARGVQTNMTPEELHLRAWVKVGPKSTALQSFLLLFGITDGMSMGATANFANFTVGIFGDLAPGYALGQETPGPPGLPSGWFCMELIERPGTADSPGFVSVEVMGVERDRTTGHLPLTTAAAFGVQNELMPDDRPLDVWFDDLIVSTSHIGCDL